MLIHDAAAWPSHDILGHWLRGWATTRGVLPPVPHADGFRIAVGLPRQRARYVFPEVSPALCELGETLVEPWVFLKACGPLDALRAILPSRWVMQPAGFMMTCGDAAFDANAALAAGYRLDVMEEAAQAHVRIGTQDGELAASGHIALDGDVAIYDRIRTEAAHQRRGLGRAVMCALQGLAHAREARRGVLVATEEGRRLYTALGWRQHSEFATAVIPDETIVP
jgi:GNAT superfamily N-acetyltransferase